MNLRKLLRGFVLALHYMVGKKQSRYRQIVLDVLRVLAMMKPTLSFTMNQVVGIVKSEGIPQRMESV